MDKQHFHKPPADNACGFTAPYHTTNGAPFPEKEYRAFLEAVAPFHRKVMEDIHRTTARIKAEREAGK
jgi:hypothetical protein